MALLQESGPEPPWLSPLDPLPEVNESRSRIGCKLDGINLWSSTELYHWQLRKNACMYTCTQRANRRTVNSFIFVILILGKELTDWHLLIVNNRIGLFDRFGGRERKTCRPNELHMYMRMIELSGFSRKPSTGYHHKPLSPNNCRARNSLYWYLKSIRHAM